MTWRVTTTRQTPSLSPLAAVACSQVEGSCLLQPGSRSAPLSPCGASGGGPSDGDGGCRRWWRWGGWETPQHRVWCEGSHCHHMACLQNKSDSAKYKNYIPYSFYYAYMLKLRYTPIVSSVQLWSVTKTYQVHHFLSLLPCQPQCSCPLCSPLATSPRLQESVISRSFILTFWILCNVTAFTMDTVNLMSSPGGWQLMEQWNYTSATRWHHHYVVVKQAGFIKNISYAYFALNRMNTICELANLQMCKIKHDLI